MSDVAVAIGVSRNTLTRLLNADNAFDVQQLSDIASYLEMPVEQIFESAALGTGTAVAS